MRNAILALMAMAITACTDRNHPLITEATVDNISLRSITYRSAFLTADDSVVISGEFIVNDHNWAKMPVTFVSEIPFTTAIALANLIERQLALLIGSAVQSKSQEDTNE